MEKIGRYHIENEVGRGGMGIVYRATDPMLNRPVAIKLLAPHLGANPESLARFHREAELIAALKHTNIATVYEFGEHNGQPYLVLEWVEGRTMQEVVAQANTLSLDRVLYISAQLANALDYAHQQGVIHRDLKPSNILIDANDKVTIVDFGLALLDNGSSLTATGALVGTPLYMSPEQIQGNPIDGRSDQYSLGIILYEMLAGQPPFTATPTSALFHQQLFLPPPSVLEIDPTLPVAVDRALTRALSKSPHDRYVTSAEFQLALRSQLPAIVQPPEVFIQSPSPQRNWLLAMGAIGLVMMGIIIGLLLVQLIERNGESVAISPTPPPTATNAVAEVVQPTDEPVIVPDETVELASSEPLTRSTWSMAGYDLWQSNFVDHSWTPLNKTSRWEQYPDSDWGTSFVAGAGIVIYSDGTQLFAYDWTSGDLLWDTLLGVEVSAPLALFNYGEEVLVYVPTDSGELYALNARDGRLFWRISGDDIGGTFTNGLLINWDTLYGVTENGLVYALNVYEREPVMRVELDDNFDHPPSVTGSGLFLTGESGTLYALDVATANIAWEVATNGTPTTPPVYSDSPSAVAIGTENGWVQVFSTLGGSVIWEAEVGSRIQGLTFDWSHLYAATEDGRLFAWYRATGDVSWQIQIDSVPLHPPITDGNYVLLTTESGEIRYFSADNGQENRAFNLELPSEIPFTPIPVGGWLYVRTADTIYAFGP